MKRKRDDIDDLLPSDPNCEIELDFMEANREVRSPTNRGTREDLGRHLLGSQIAATIAGDTLEETAAPPPPQHEGNSETQTETSFWEHCLSAFPYAAPLPGTLPVTQSIQALHRTRFCNFLEAYLGYSPDEALKAYRCARGNSMIGVVRVKSRYFHHIKSTRVFLRHSVLSVEGDAFFCILIERAKYLQQNRERTHNTPSSSGSVGTAHPNARCVALHYGLHNSGEGGAFQRCTLLVILSSTRIEKDAEVILSMESYYRCLDEVRWYREYYDTAAGFDPTVDTDVEGDIFTGSRRLTRWPAGLSYFHGIGDRHASNTAEASFPFTLVRLDGTPELGPNDLGVTALYPIPYATCFIYAGPSITTKKVQLLAQKANSSDQLLEEEDLSFARDDTYALGLGKHAVCFGQGLARYINHRYNLSRYGNVELCSVMLTVQNDLFEEAQPKKQSKRRKHDRYRKNRSSKFLEEHSRNVTIPFFITTTDITEGEQLLAWTYGEDYDAKLEREVVADGYLVPYADASLLNARYLKYFTEDGVPRTAGAGRPLWQRYNGDYRFAVKEGDIVWRRRPYNTTTTNGTPKLVCPPAERDLFVVVSMMKNGIDYVLLRPLSPFPQSKKDLRTLLDQLKLSSYCSPHAPSVTGKNERHRSSGSWAVYTYDTNAKGPSSGGTTEFFVASIASVVPLQNETDYLLHPQSSTRMCVIINLDDIRHATSFVLKSDRCCETEPLLSSDVWPLLVNAKKADS
ncbi:hypothetical protein AGDE_12245 [Angomonas deanei]|uniref:SET domain containing protein n=1 Tax=Angomonas deanei TaxID=59799 RepID=A0A7G2CK70_9TRYP|nr:hypothetical protein AGDE_12245 [Angomonas deanei]CAD2220268.1 hypothetical protein, conserved [Angomonas deanei]|eukprot:EPY24641.1 hypothetical protein AGDE_12245 [Angomonas deanei]